jgi:hypothetical protein
MFNLEKTGAVWQRKENRAKIMGAAELSIPVGNLCIFQCTKCQREFHTYKTLIKHLREKSHGCYSIGKNINDNLKFCKKLVGHECRVCHERKICDTSYLEAHFFKRHKISSVSDYCRIFGVQKRKLKVIPEHLLATEELSTTIGDLCKFECHICKEKYNS